MRMVLWLAAMIFYVTGFSQVSTAKGGFFAKEFSKDAALYKAKQYVLTTVLGSANEVVKFEIDPLAATGSGELTSLVYRCADKKKEGLVLGFFGDRWNDAGVIYQSYSFKDYPKDKAIELLTAIEKSIDDNSKYLSKDADNNNIYFQFDDLTFLVYTKFTTKIRVFWNDYDAEWDLSAFKRTKKRLLNKLD